MAKLRAIILDVDGTILDSNRLHAEAWSRSFAAHGLTISTETVLPQIGKGSDKLVPALAPDLPQDKGDEIRDSTPKYFTKMAHDRGIKPLPGLAELVRAARARDLKLAIASSARRNDFKTLVKTSGVDVPEVAEEIVLGDDVEGTKPEPDLVLAAIEKLGLRPDECVMVGDTPYDAEAARRAGASAICVLTGVHDEAALRASGAQWVFRDLADVAANVDRVLDDARNI